MALKPAIFLDKDGTVLADVPYNVDPALMRFEDGAEEGLSRMSSLGWPLIIITNQPGVALGLYPVSAMQIVQDALRALFTKAGATLHGYYYCPHHPEGSQISHAIECTCRKPKPGLLTRAAAEHDIDLPASWFIGDILDDVEAGNRAGCRTILLVNGHETEWRDGPWRSPHHCAADLNEASRIIEASMHPVPESCGACK